MADDERDGVVRVPVGQPGRGVEFLVHEADTHPRRVDAAAQAALGERDPWVTVATADAGRTADRLAEHGFRTPAEPEWLMTIRLPTQHRGRFADGYAPELLRDPGMVRLAVRAADGTLAATGQLAVTGEVAVPDRIRTAPAHRRRGLGAAMMTALVDEAASAGAVTGVLMASTQGRALYTALGWKTLCPVVVARLWE